MSNQLLIYKTAVPVSSGRHGKASVEVGADYGFARQVNSVPLMAVEFPNAEPEYPIVFAANGDSVLPVVVLGVRQSENLYLADDGRWRADYVPAFLRRYPFVFSASDDGQTFTLCVDEACQGLNFQGRGRPLFEPDGQPSGYVQDVLNFLQEYRAQFARTETFCRNLKDLDLLEPMQAQFTMTEGEKMSVTGFSVVNRDRLKALDDEQLGRLARTDELELVYAHLQSMRNFNRLKDWLVSQSPQSAASA